MDEGVIYYTHGVMGGWEDDSMAAWQRGNSQLATVPNSKKATLGQGGTLVTILGPPLDFRLRLTTSNSNSELQLPSLRSQLVLISY